MITLHPHERAALSRAGRVLLVRPVELPQFTPPTIETWAVNDDGLWTGYGDLGMCNGVSGALTERLHCPLGRPGDLLTTDSGPVTVERVRVGRCVELEEEDVMAWGVSCIHCGKLLAEECRCALVDADYHEDAARLWSTLFPAYPWEQAWCWMVEVTRKGE